MVGVIEAGWSLPVIDALLVIDACEALAEGPDEEVDAVIPIVCRA